MVSGTSERHRAADDQKRKGCKMPENKAEKNITAATTKVYK